MNTRQTHFKQMSNKDSKVPVSKLKTLLASFGENYTEKKIKDVTRALEITSSSVSFTEFLENFGQDSFEFSDNDTFRQG